jgi:hypothetical protein
MSITVYPAANADDSFGDRQNGAFYPADFYWARSLIENYKDGVCRFPNVTIPQGALLDVATITLTPKGSIDYNCSTNVFAVDENNADAPTDYTTFAALTLTTAYTTGTLIKDAVTTISCIDAAQEVISRAGWASGNALTLIFRVNHSGGLPCYRGYSYNDADAAKYPKLIIGQATITISSFTPSSGPFGTRITITGTNYSTTTTDNTVKVGGVAMTVISSTTTEIVASVPPNAVSGAITVDRTGYAQGVSATNFTVTYIPYVMTIR